MLETVASTLTTPVNNIPNIQEQSQISEQNATQQSQESNFFPLGYVANQVVFTRYKVSDCLFKYSFISKVILRSGAVKTMDHITDNSNGYVK